MTVATLPAVDLLERAVGYTRGALGEVRPPMLGRATPCRGWHLGRLLVHMEDSLDAFTEASEGFVELAPTPATGPVLERIRSKACTLLGAWARPPDRDAVVVGDRALPTDLLVCAGALEITVHGWDVARATGHPTDVPEDLARRLLVVADLVIGPPDRPTRFAPPPPTRAGASYADRLIAVTGRRP